MSVHVLLTLIIIILFHSADLVSTSILNVSGAPTGSPAVSHYKHLPHLQVVGQVEWLLIQSTTLPQHCSLICTHDEQFPSGKPHRVWLWPECHVWACAAWSETQIQHLLCFMSSLVQFAPKTHDETKRCELVRLSSTQAGWRCRLRTLCFWQRPVLEYEVRHLFQQPTSL